MNGLSRTRISVIAIVLPCLWTACFASPGAAKSPEEIYAEIFSSIVVVEAVQGASMDPSITLGSGVVIGVGEVATNCHVAQNGERLRVQWGNRVMEARVIWADSEIDLCRLSVVGLRAPAVRIGSTRHLQVGQRVYALGAPKGYALTFSEGIISALRPASAVIDSKSRRLAAQRMIQTTAAISLGSSGGGLFDADGRLIGITTLQDISGQNLNFAMPVESLSASPQTPHGRTIDEPQRQTEKKPGTSLRGEGPMTAADYRAMTDYLRRITARMSVQDWNGVVKLAGAATQSYPSMPIFWIDLGWGYAELDDRARSRSAYEEARRQAVNQSQHYPDDFTVWVDLAQAHRGLGDLPLAIAAYLKALQRQPNDLWSWYDMGALHARLHHRPDVIRVYERLRSLDRDVAQDFFVRFVIQE